VLFMHAYDMPACLQLSFYSSVVDTYTWFAVATCRSMGDKAQAKAIMAAAGVPVVPGYHGEQQEQDRWAHNEDNDKHN
jgi:hypothetical protein